MRRLAFISLEFSAATFSGNGVYARSQVRVSYVVRPDETCNLACRQWFFDWLAGQELVQAAM